MSRNNKTSVCRELERRILAAKRFDDFMPQARLFEEFWMRKCWRCLGYPRVLEWIKVRYPESMGRPYQLLRIAKRLGPHVSDKELHEIGISKCDELARGLRRGAKPDPAIVQKAKELPYDVFERYAEQLRLGGRANVEFGEPLEPSFRGLQNAPVNELGVVYLFGLVSRDLGFIVDAIQPGYPDCNAKERVKGRPERWRQVRIEFEYRSSNFNHPPEGCDIVVCWEHDRPDCPVKRVIELKSRIKQLSPMIPKLGKD